MSICNIVPEQARLSHDGTCDLLGIECEKKLHFESFEVLISLRRRLKQPGK